VLRFPPLNTLLDFDILSEKEVMLTKNFKNPQACFLCPDDPRTLLKGVFRIGEKDPPLEGTELFAHPPLLQESSYLALVRERHGCFFVPHVQLTAPFDWSVM